MSTLLLSFTRATFAGAHKSAAFAFADACSMLLYLCHFKRDHYCFMVHAGECVLRMSFVQTGLEDATSLHRSTCATPLATETVMMMSRVCYGQHLLHMCSLAAQWCCPRGFVLHQQHVPSEAGRCKVPRHCYVLLQAKE